MSTKDMPAWPEKPANAMCTCGWTSSRMVLGGPTPLDKRIYNELCGVHGEYALTYALYQAKLADAAMARLRVAVEALDCIRQSQCETSMHAYASQALLTIGPLPR